MSTLIHTAILVARATTWGALSLLLLRVTLVVACGRLALAFMPHASAATRHLVMMATLVALIALPILMLLVPAWRVPILPRSIVAPASVRAAVTPSVPFVRRTLDMINGDEPYVGPATVALAAPTRSSFLPEPIEHVVPVVPPSRGPAPSSLPAAPLAVVSLIVAIVELLLIRLVITSIAAGRLSRRAEHVVDTRLLRVLDAARDRLGLRRDVRLMTSTRIGVPVVVGMWRPVLLLPPEAMSWDRERLEVVFLHELAHVRRGDAWSLLLARAASALYWFHPIVVALVRDARGECERACDDCVLTSGVRASNYAEHLLTIARASMGRALPTGAVLAIARTSHLERRLSSILSSERPRGAASRTAVVMTGVFALALSLPLASARVTATPVHMTAASSHGTSRPSAPASPRGVTTPGVPAPAAKHPVTSWDDKVAHDTRSGHELWSRAKRLYDDERYDESGDLYVKAAKAGYRMDTALYNAACSYALAGRRDDALSTLSDALGAGWDDANMLRTDDDLRSIRRDPRFAKLLAEARATDSNVSEKRSALATLEALRARHSDDADDWGSVGIDLMRADEASRSAQAFEEQVRIEPSSTSYYNLGCARARNHETGKALEALRLAINEGYDDADHMADDEDLENLHGQAGFESMVKLCGDLSLYHHGIWDDDRMSWRSELPEYERITQAYPMIGKAWFNLGYAQLRTRDARSAALSFYKALELKYRPATTQYNLACCAAQMKDAGETMKWLERAQAAGMNLTWQLHSDRDLDPVRSDARFRDMVHRSDAEWASSHWKFDGKHKDRGD